MYDLYITLIIALATVSTYSTQYARVDVSVILSNFLCHLTLITANRLMLISFLVC